MPVNFITDLNTLKYNNDYFLQLFNVFPLK